MFNHKIFLSFIFICLTYQVVYSASFEKKEDDSPTNHPLCQTPATLVYDLRDKAPCLGFIKRAHRFKDGWRAFVLSEDGKLALNFLGNKKGECHRHPALFKAIQGQNSKARVALAGEINIVDLKPLACTNKSGTYRINLDECFSQLKNHELQSIPNEWKNTFYQMQNFLEDEPLK